MVVAQDVRLCLGIQLQKQSIENALQFTRYDQLKLRVQIWIVQIWKAQKLKLMMLLDVGSQYENVGKRITTLKITNQVIQHCIESA